MDITASKAAGIYQTIGKIAGSQAGDDATGETGASGSTGGASGFMALVENSIQKSLDALHHSEHVSADAIAGKAGLNDLVAAVTNAELTLQTVVAVRDRVINAYQDIVKMPI